MLIHEKGMVAAMKKAAGASGQGLHVAAWKEDGRLWVFLYTNFWCAASAWEKLPRKVKGLLAEYMGELPGAGDAVEITKKNGVQSEVHTFAERTIAGYRGAMSSEDKVKAKATPLTESEMYTLWQTAKGEIIPMPQPIEQVALLPSGAYYVSEGNVMYTIDDDSQIFLKPTVPTGQRAENMKHLGKVRWVNV